MGIPIKDYTYQNILFVHNFIFIFLIFIFCLILVFFVVILTIFNYNNRIILNKLYNLAFLKKLNSKSINNFSKQQKNFVKYINVSWNKTHNIVLELLWTMFPIWIIIELIFPSLSLVADDEIDNESSIQTVNVIGNQWYWDYELNVNSDTKAISSNLIVLEEGNNSHKNLTRLLATTESIMIPVGIKTSFYITSNDVIHSWAVPGLGIKVDAIPGRINFKNIITTRLGLYSGMCSELCGIDHGFMPISLKSLTYSNYIYILGMDKMIIKKEQQWTI